MNHALIKKYWGESWLLLAACGFILPIFCWVRIWIVAQFELSRLQPLLEQLRPFEKFSPVPLEQFLTYAGSIAITFDEPVVILCVLVWSISRGSDLVSGELGRGTMEMLLSQPIRRRAVVWAHACVTIIGLALLCALVWLGIYLGIQTQSVREAAPQAGFTLPFIPYEFRLPQNGAETIVVPLRDRVDSTLYLPPAFNLFAFGFFMLGLSVFFSCLDRYRWRTIGAVISVYVLQFMLYLLGKATPSTAWALWLTFFSAYRPDDMVQRINKEPEVAWAVLQFSTDGTLIDLGPFGYSLLLIAMGTALYVAGSVYFCKRDLPAPL